MRYWFDEDFVRCVAFVFGNGVFFAYCALALYREDYRWLVNAFFEGGLCALGYCFYRYWYPVIRWYYRTVRVSAYLLGESMSKPTHIAVEVGAVEAKYQEKGTLEAPDNMVWVCGVCGKRSRTRYGFNENEENVCDSGWDASCVMNAVLCYKLGQEPAQS